MHDDPSAPPGTTSMDISDADFEAACRRGSLAQPALHAVSARYDAERAALVIELENGTFVGFPVAGLQGLQDATAQQLANVKLEAAGHGLHWPDLDVDLSVPALLAGIFGSKRWIAARLGAEGGKARSGRKTASSRLNGKKGGRPKKTATA